MKTIIYYYSATGNSLYTAQRLQQEIEGAEIRSMVKLLRSNSFAVEADCVGFVFPMHYFGLPLQVEEFLRKIDLVKPKYTFAVATCGVPYWGRPFLDAQNILAEKNIELTASWYVRLVSNYIPYRDIAADWRIAIRSWLAEKKLHKIAKAINAGEKHQTWQLLKNFCRKYHDTWAARQEKIDEAFICDKDSCIACGMCENICPRSNITRPAGNPVWNHSCIECLACLHICPVKAINYGEITRERKRYRHKKIRPDELFV